MSSKRYYHELFRLWNGNCANVSSVLRISLLEILIVSLNCDSFVVHSPTKWVNIKGSLS